MIIEMTNQIKEKMDKHPQSGTREAVRQAETSAR
jgi:hypothetical protein